MNRNKSVGSFPRNIHPVKRPLSKRRSRIFADISPIRTTYKHKNPLSLSPEALRSHPSAETVSEKPSNFHSDKLRPVKKEDEEISASESPEQSRTKPNKTWWQMIKLFFRAIWPFHITPRSKRFPNGMPK